jgi:hypothetical protein
MATYKEQEINARVSIRASYDDAVVIEVRDSGAGIQFLEIVMTREQYINATMNRLADTETKSTLVRGLDKVGKRLSMKQFEFEIPVSGDEKGAINLVQKLCPEGYVPDLSFRSQGSFFTKDGKHYARTTLRRWD